MPVNSDPAEAESRAIALWRRLLYSLLVLVSFLSLPESILRFFGGTFPELPRHDWISGQFQPDPWNKWTLKPGASVGKGGHISPEGFRDTPLKHPRPPGERRVLVLGDSSVFGAGVLQEETFVQKLEQALNPPGISPESRPVQIINAGVPGYTTYQCIELLKRSLYLEPEGVIFYNISDSGTPEGLNDDLWFHWGAPLHVFFRHSYVYRWLQYQVWSRQEPRTDAEPRPGGLRVHIRHYRENLRALRQLADSAGAWMLYVVPPVLSDSEPRPPQGRMSSREAAGPSFAQIPIEYMPRDQAQADALLERLVYLESRDSLDAKLSDFRAALVLDARQAQVPVVDGPSLFRAIWRREPESRGNLLLDQVHPSPRGHQVLADAIATELEPLSR